MQAVWWILGGLPAGATFDSPSLPSAGRLWILPMIIMHWHVGTFSRKGGEVSSFELLFPEMSQILSAQAKEEFSHVPVRHTTHTKHRTTPRASPTAHGQVYRCRVLQRSVLQAIQVGRCAVRLLELSATSEPTTLAPFSLAACCLLLAWQMRPTLYTQWYKQCYQAWAHQFPAAYRVAKYVHDFMVDLVLWRYTTPPNPPRSRAPACQRAQHVVRNDEI